MKNSYQFSAPGSIMLMGEHAVLREKTALVGAIDKRITVTLTPHEDNRIDIYSALGEYHEKLNDLKDASVFRFILSTIRFYLAHIHNGFRLNIHSEFSSEVGLGSSAAVVVATCACLKDWLIQHFDQEQLFLDARAIIQHTQGRGSGADVAASVFGGIIKYRMTPICIEKSENIVDIALIYTGYKTPTPEVIKIVDQRVALNPKKYALLFEKINTYSERAWNAIHQKDLLLLGQMMDQHQKTQNLLGVCDEKTSQLLYSLHHHQQVLGSKISGSGLGDCVVALVSPGFQWKNNEFMKIDAHLSKQGVVCENQ